MAVQVELDALSGFPNPTWALDPRQELQFEAKLAKLPKGTANTSLRDVSLGYRGIECTLLRPGEPARRVTVFEGAVVVLDRVQRVVLRDPGRQVERWLLQTGKGAVPAGLYGDVESEIRAVGPMAV